MGGNILKWDYEKCKDECLKYKTKKELRKNSQGCYLRIRREKWLELFEHMIYGKIKWTKEKCMDEIKNYKSYSEYRNTSKSYAPARDNKWLSEICEYFKIKKQKHKGYWNKDRCHEESLKYKTRKEFSKISRSAYISAYRNKWLDDICSHMIKNPNHHS